MRPAAKFKVRVDSGSAAWYNNIRKLLGNNVFGDCCCTLAVGQTGQAHRVMAVHGAVDLLLPGLVEVAQIMDAIGLGADGTEQDPSHSAGGRGPQAGFEAGARVSSRAMASRM